MSFYNIPIDKLSEVKIKDVEIKNIYTSDHPVKIGNLIGNRFEITVSNIDKKIKSDSVKDVISFIEKYGGFPNFYGIQRFGIVRPITHVVGKYIVKGDFGEVGRVSAADSNCTNHSGNQGGPGGYCYGYQFMSSVDITKNYDYLYITVGCELAAESFYNGASNGKCDADGTVDSTFTEPAIRVFIEIIE